MTDIPASLLQSLEKREEFSKDSFLKAHEDVPAVSVRLNPQKTVTASELWKGTTPVPWNTYGYYLPLRPSFVMDPYLHAGCYYVQEASSMFIGEILRQLQLPTNAKVLDLCAAPGGKSTLLASYFSDGMIVANEVIKNRASVLVENTTKWGSGNFIVTNNDPRQFGQFPNYFDLMLVDAPCSGSGLFRKETEWREGWSEENVALCSQRQKRILADAYDTLNENGILIYSTCSFSQEEDEDIVDWLLDNYALENISFPVPQEWGIAETISEKHQAHAYRFYPGKVRGEGFFVSVFRKRERSTAMSWHREAMLDQPSKSESELLYRWLNSPENACIYKVSDSFHVIDKKWELDLKMLKAHFYLKKGGTEMGNIKGKDLIPSVDLALSHWPHEGAPKAALDQDEAIQYLKKMEVSRKENFTNGWTMACYENHPLGWMKVMPNRINNYYPMEWRIRKQ